MTRAREDFGHIGGKNEFPGTKRAPACDMRTALRGLGRGKHLQVVRADADMWYIKSGKILAKGSELDRIQKAMCERTLHDRITLNLVNLNFVKNCNK